MPDMVTTCFTPSRPARRMVRRRSSAYEQTPVPGADFGLTVNAVHLAAGGLVDVVVGSATSDAQNCL
ncbi:hypothetical protein ACIBJF_39165 [Streptomyces sp. NPDC050743]|uniref:hypothetical protein n=1 Tax=Streptomyces sp. NPDC050743 TaxID=3365634 RepID=UPI0037BBBED3